MTQARAFAPGNISGVFKIIPNDDPARMHSLGMGLTVADGVTVVVEEAAGTGTTVHFNGELVDFPTVTMVVERLAHRPLHLDLCTSLPLSSGFGLSGAASLAAAYAVDELLGLGRPRQELAMAAHVAEVENLTGLGDVSGQFHGGCLVKLRPGEPLAVEPLDVPQQPIHYRHFSPISTRDILSDPVRRERINRAADKALATLGEVVGRPDIDLDACIHVCREFAVESGLLQHQGVRQVIDEVEGSGGAASMIMLGNAVFSTRPFEGSAATSLSVRAAEVLDD